MAKVYIAKCKTYNPKEVYENLSSIFDVMEAKEIFTGKNTVLLKPNLLSANLPEMAVTTHPQVFGAVAKKMLEYKLEVSYGDCPATDSSSKAANVCGIYDIAKELNIKEGDFKNSYIAKHPQGAIAKEFRFVNAVKENEVIISLAKFKTHALTGFTGAMKNQFGLIPGLLKAKDHVKYPSEYVFSKMLVDLNKCLDPKLYVMDAIVGMEGNGPANGDPRQIGYLMASQDPVALDSFCASMMGLKWDEVMSVKSGHDMNLGTGDIKQIEIIYIERENDKINVTTKTANEFLPEFELKDFKNAISQKSTIGTLNSIGAPIARKLFLNRPYIIENKCTKCKKCVEVCPVEPKAIKFDEKRGKIIYSYTKCIRCFCCQETCPFGAIAVKKGPLQFLFERKSK